MNHVKEYAPCAWRGGLPLRKAQNAAYYITMLQPLLQVTDLTKYFNNKPVIKKLNFTLRAGEVVGLLGPNGAGKTTALRLLSGFMQPDAGSIEIAGISLKDKRIKTQKRVGYVQETTPQYAHITGKEYVRHHARIFGVDATPDVVESVLRLTRSLDYADMLLAEMSRGMQQRIQLAAAIIHAPDVLMMDEPTAGLDPNQRKVMAKVFRELAQSRVVLLSTHSLTEAAEMCDRLLVMVNGRIMLDCTPQELIKQGGGDMYRAFKVLTQNKGHKNS